MACFECPAVEFGYELALCVPHAYWGWQRGVYVATSSVPGTRSLYFFNGAHQERAGAQRACVRLPPEFDNRDFNTPLDTARWCLPPYKQRFANAVFGWDKPMVVLHNKHTVEWSERAYNFIDQATLDALLDCLTPLFHVVYIAPLGTEPGYTKDCNMMLPDCAQPQPRAGLTMFQDLLAAHPELDYNTAQLMVHANCERFISVHGGCALLASMFGGTHVTLAVKGNTHMADMYPQLSGARVQVVPDCAQLLAAVRATFTGE